MERNIYECSGCGIKDWNGQPISLQLDHINGDNKDNRLENVRWLCPNCHSQTSTWGTRNMSDEGRKKCSTKRRQSTPYVV
ncbi:MAG: HNH endonuclease signature motif containing protein [Candidatus Puniceispirillaceae bacterium]